MQLTRDGGANWTNVTSNIPGLPPLGTVSNVEPSRYDAGAAYITVDLHQVNNRDPFVYKTTDYGASWTLIGGPDAEDIRGVWGTSPLDVFAARDLEAQGGREGHVGPGLGLGASRAGEVQGQAGDDAAPSRRAALADEGRLSRRRLHRFRDCYKTGRR